MAMLAALVPIMTAVGTALSVAGTIQQGRAAKAAGEYEAAGMERQGAEDFASSQRQAEEQRIKTDTQLSRVRALAADSGAGVNNPTINDIYGDTAQYGDFLARSEVYGGKSRQAGNTDAAAASRFKGNSAYQGSILEGIGTGLMGAAKVAGGSDSGSDDYYYGRSPRRTGYH